MSNVLCVRCAKRAAYYCLDCSGEFYANRPAGCEPADASSAKRLADLQRALSWLYDARSLRAEAAHCEQEARTILGSVAYPQAPHLREGSARKGQRSGEAVHGANPQAPQVRLDEALCATHGVPELQRVLDDGR